MSRQTFVWCPEQQKIVPAHERARFMKFGDAPVVVGDIQPFRTIDGVEIGSRSSLRAYEQANGVRQCGNDWTGSSKPSWWGNRRER